MSRIKTNTKHGFTIVELLIVIVVIAILATISIIAYNGIQGRARDAQRKSDLSSLSKVMLIRKLDKGGHPSIATGCEAGSSGAGLGWLNLNYNTSASSKSVSQCLVDEKYLSTNIVDPSKLSSCSGESCHAYMVYTCAAGTWLYANLETLTQDSTATDGTCASSWGTLYGINYVLKVD